MQKHRKPPRRRTGRLPSARPRGNPHPADFRQAPQRRLRQRSCKAFHGAGNSRCKGKPAQTAQAHTASALRLHRQTTLQQPLRWIRRSICHPMQPIRSRKRPAATEIRHPNRYRVRPRGRKGRRGESASRKVSIAVSTHSSHFYRYSLLYRAGGQLANTSEKWGKGGAKKENASVLQWQTEAAAEQRREGWPFPPTQQKMRFCGCGISVHNAHKRSPLPCLDANKPRAINRGMGQLDGIWRMRRKNGSEAGARGLYVEDAPCSGARLLPPLGAECSRAFLVGRGSPA